MKRLALLLLVAAGACITELERVPISFVGTVTEAGVPIEGAVLSLFRPSVNGLPELQGGMVTLADGRYSFATDIDEQRCFMVFVEVEVLGPTGAPLYDDRRNADTCGQNTADFDF